jgi:hypothetical protein
MKHTSYAYNDNTSSWLVSIHKDLLGRKMNSAFCPKGREVAGGRALAAEGARDVFIKSSSLLFKACCSDFV